MLALVSYPSPVADAGSVYTFSREAVLVTGFRRGGVGEQDKVKQHVHHQISADAPQIAVGGHPGAKEDQSALISPHWIHFSLLLFDRSDLIRAELGGPPGGVLLRKPWQLGLVYVFTNKSCMLAECYAYSE